MDAGGHSLSRTCEKNFDALPGAACPGARRAAATNSKRDSEHHLLMMLRELLERGT